MHRKSRGYSTHPRMSGRWLEECGFAIGSVVRVRVEHGRLTLISEGMEA
ncbi:MAG TPA: SymE family type I addiction module toxin [Thermoanaerobaculia bacterium]|nr:SymE family type I addiction module toxin [Thermoanaerobaculia bacterium]